MENKLTTEAIADSPFCIVKNMPCLCICKNIAGSLPELIIKLEDSLGDALILTDIAIEREDIAEVRRTFKKSVKIYIEICKDLKNLYSPPRVNEEETKRSLT